MPSHSLLDSLPAELRQYADRHLHPIALQPGQIIYRSGDQCQGLPLLLSGSVRVQMLGASGNGIVLYRMGQDDICTLSIGCLMSQRDYRAEALVEEAGSALLLPRDSFERLLDASPAFRRLVLASYGRRLDDLMMLVEEVAFRRMDQRLLDWLQQHADQRCIQITHQALAEELGTAREVVSRLLKELEREGRVQLGRGRIDLLH